MERGLRVSRLGTELRCLVVCTALSERDRGRESERDDKAHKNMDQRGEREDGSHTHISCILWSAACRCSDIRSDQLLESARDTEKKNIMQRQDEKSECTHPVIVKKWGAQSFSSRSVPEGSRYVSHSIAGEMMRPLHGCIAQHSSEGTGTSVRLQIIGH